MNEQEQKKVIKEVGETITEKPLEFEIDVKPNSKFEAWLIKRKIKPSKRFFEIKPQRVINIYRIATRAVSVDLNGINPNESITIGEGVRRLMDIMSRHGEDIFYIVACAIQNDHREPTAENLQFVKNQLEMDDVFKILVYAVSNYKIQSFMNSIALIVGVNDLDVKTPNAPQNEKASPNEIGS